ncbi:MAG: flavin reductase family protein [Candidatus Caldarchaeum sp.]
MKRIPFELFHRLFYPQIAMVVASRMGDEAGGLLASSVMPVSFNPPKIAAALGKAHKTTKLVEHSNVFSVNWLSYEHVSKMALLAQPTAPGVKDKLSSSGFQFRLGEKTKAPILLDASAYLECRVEMKIDVGDHFLFLSIVEDAVAIEDFGEYWEFRGYKPVLYVGSARSDWPKLVKFPLE